MFFDSRAFTRPPIRDTVIDDPLFYQGGWTVELKQNGRWGWLIIQNGLGRIFTRANMACGEEFKFLTHFNAVLAGEYMFSSNWAYQHGEEGVFHAFDLLQVDCLTIHRMELVARRPALWQLVKQLSNPKIKVNPTWAVEDVDQVRKLWDTYVEQGGYEGLVFKHSKETFGYPWFRVKKRFTVDYVVVGFAEGGGKNKGRLGGLQGGLFMPDGSLKFCCQVGGGFSDEQRQEIWDHQDDYFGRVFEAYGWDVYSSGALRHPNVDGNHIWRDDKLASECLFANLPIGSAEEASDGK